MVRKNPELFPAIPPKPVDEPSRVNWLLALIEALRNLNLRDLALKLLERLVAQFPGYAQVVEAYNALANELGIAAESSEMTTTSVPTSVTTTEKLTTTAAATITTAADKITTTTKATTATKATTTAKSTTTTKASASKIELSNYRNMSFDELAQALGCDVDITHTLDSTIDATTEARAYASVKANITTMEVKSNGYKMINVICGDPSPRAC